MHRIEQYIAPTRQHGCGHGKGERGSVPQPAVSDFLHASAIGRRSVPSIGQRLGQWNHQGIIKLDADPMHVFRDQVRVEVHQSLEERELEEYATFHVLSR